MKQLRRIITTAALVCAVLLSACKKDDGGDSPLKGSWGYEAMNETDAAYSVVVDFRSDDGKRTLSPADGEAETTRFAYTDHGRGRFTAGYNFEVPVAGSGEQSIMYLVTYEYTITSSNGSKFLALKRISEGFDPYRPTAGTDDFLHGTLFGDAETLTLERK